MRQYDSYKDSGVESIKVIPNHWNTIQLKNALKGMQDGTHGTFERIPSQYLLLSAKNVFEDGIHISDNESSISEEDYKIITSNGYPQLNDIAICCVGTIGRCCIYKEPTALAFQRSVTFLRVKYNVNVSYILYSLRSAISQIQLNMLAKTSAQSGIYMKDLSTIKVFLPTCSEQQAIASYLDKKCAEIDKAIETQTKRIELLKELRQNIITHAVTRGLNPNAPLKDSGIEWIKKIPSHWSSVPLKFTVESPYNSFIDGDWIESKVIESEGIRYLTTGNVGVINYKEQGNGFISEKTFKDLHCSEVYPGDILISRLNEPIGRCCIVPDLGFRIVVAVDNVIYRPNEKLYDKRYLVYQMNCKPYSDQANVIARGSTMSRVSRTSLGQFKLVVPPLSEQILISEHLDKKCIEIEKNISKAGIQISLLQELKQSIITEVVTGKRKVC